MNVQMSSLHENRAGRFGNKLFAYFFLTLLSHECGMNIRTSDWLGTSIFGLTSGGLAAPDADTPVLNLQGRIDRNGSPRHEMALIQHFQEQGLAALELFGFFQYHTSLYREWIDLFRATFTRSEDTERALQSALDSHGLGRAPIIAVHIRRGDYLIQGDHPLFWGSSFNSVVKAISDLTSTAYRNCVIYLCSDDLEHCKAEFELRKIPFVTHENLCPSPDGQAQLAFDFCMMARASALLISNSSLSFGAAMLNSVGRISCGPVPSKTATSPSTRGTRTSCCEKHVSTQAPSSPELSKHMLIDFSQCNRLIADLHGAPAKKVFHVGAHIGEEALFYAENQVEEVVWFEANQQLIPTLSQNISHFGGMKQFIVPFALFDENKTLSFNITNNLQSSSFFKLDKHAEYYPQIVVQEVRSVQAYRLDALCDLRPPCLPWLDVEFINIDTQGAELAVLRGMGEYLDQPSIKGIYLEVNAESLYEDIPLLSQIDTFLSARGYCRIRTAWTERGWGDAFYIKSVTSR